ncbi:11518_t:CDS:2, partial [Funneliformis caledonium]
DKARRISEAQPIVERLLWFRYALDDALPCATNAKVYDLIEIQWDGDTNSMLRIKTIRKEDPNNINNLKTTAQNLAKKQKSSIYIISNSAMAIDQTNMKNEEYEGEKEELENEKKKLEERRDKWKVLYQEVLREEK